MYSPFAIHLTVSIHAPPEGRDSRRTAYLLESNTVSIHAPPEGRDPKQAATKKPITLFQSTRPRRGAIAAAAGSFAVPGCFNPRAPGGARLLLTGMYRCSQMFQSTRPRRGAIYPSLWRPLPRPVSIHAPPEGRDSAFNISSWLWGTFQSTRPRRGAIG